ncbi:MAG: phosphate/phosphite/phosphonate ABC transporter substrate-binding protein [bacterium]|nr:phosphate/phosphite/phosphonate ABC transporter substrate-binding protein [bacterium]
MPKSTIFSAAAALLTLFACLPSCTSEAAPRELRFSVLPDFHKTETDKNAATLAERLTQKLGMPVKYLRANDYTGAVNNLISNKIDFVWLGGKTTVDAIDAGKGHVRVLATRDVDLAFKTYFIANADVIAAGRIGPLTDLADLKSKARDLTFTFGDKNSTSGHLMPRHFLTQAGIDPDQAFKVAGYRESGSHGATLEAVVSGEVDVGALNYGHWEKADAATKSKAPVIHTTPPYVDYAWVGHDRIGKELLGRITATFLELDPDNADDRAILDAWGVKERFLAAENSQWDSIRQVRDSLPKGFLK